MFLSSLLPIVPANVICIPWTISLLLNERITAGVFLFITQQLLFNQVDNYNYSRVPVDSYVSGLAFFFGFAVFGIQGILFGPLLLCLGSFAYEAIGWLADDFKGDDNDDDDENESKSQGSSNAIRRLRRASRRFISPLTFPISDDDDDDNDDSSRVLDVGVKGVPGVDDGSHRIRVSKKKSLSLKLPVIEALLEGKEKKSFNLNRYKICTDTGVIVHDISLLKSDERLLVTFSSS